MMHKLTGKFKNDNFGILKKQELNMENSTTKDSNGTILNEGDTVFVIKDLKVKSSSSVIKRGTVVKNIRLTDNDKEIEGRIERTVIVLRTEFLKKSYIYLLYSNRAHHVAFLA